MSRKGREKSGTGIYHVMLRGINRQDIFEDAEDYMSFTKILAAVQDRLEDDLITKTTTCHIYAYCLMPNHVHLLLCEKNWQVGDVMKSIASSYVFYYNKKYGRIGHLFQDRFRSEPCNTPEYFFTLFRYIHQNPVAANLVSDINDYTWSSWREYVNPNRCSLPVCATQSVLTKLPIDELKALVAEPLPKAQKILEINNTSSRIDDDMVQNYIVTLCGPDYLEVINHYNLDEKRVLIRKLLEFGASMRQISRLTGLSLKTIRLSQ
jgi:REP element-mobilizing transposase RayT